MRAQIKNDPITALDRVLEAEREALLKGELERLSDLLDQKETLIGELNHAADVDAPELKALDVKLRRNQQLLDGAMEGIRAVAARLAKLREVKGRFETYDSNGQKRDILKGGDASVEQRI